MKIKSDTKNKFLVLIASLFIVCQVCVVPANAQNKKTVVKRYSAVASTGGGLTLEDGLKELDFKFNISEMSAWVRANGEWHIEGLISHNNFLCADYSVGMRFGEGNPGCIDVKWLTEDQYVTRKKQCNNVDMIHSGSQTSPEVVPIFDKISCAEAVVKCEGACK
jgi:hypothetical protein